MTTPLTAAAQLAVIITKDMAEAPAPTPAIGDNSKVAFKAETIKRAEMYGVQHARGEASLTKLAFWFAEGVRADLLSESDAEAIYTAFVAGHNRHIATTGTGHEAMATDEKSLKASVSTFRTFGKRGPVAQGEGFYARVLTVRHGIGPSDRLGSAYNAMVTVNRKIVALAEKAAHVNVSDDEIRAWISKKPVVEKDELAKLEELVVKLAKLAIANPVTLTGLTEPTSALEAYVARVKLSLAVRTPQTDIIPADVLAKLEAREELEAA